MRPSRWSRRFEIRMPPGYTVRSLQQENGEGPLGALPADEALADSGPSPSSALLELLPHLETLAEGDDGFTLRALLVLKPGVETDEDPDPYAMSREEEGALGAIPDLSDEWDEEDQEGDEGADEDEVPLFLVERDGALFWVFPEEVSREEEEGPLGALPGSSGARRRLRLDLQEGLERMDALVDYAEVLVKPNATPVDVLTDKVKVAVFSFAANKVAVRALESWEQRQRPAKLFQFQKEAWSELAEGQAPECAGGVPERAVLLLPGAFLNLASSYRCLTGAETEFTLLRELEQSGLLVLGADYPAMTGTPQFNSLALVRLLEKHRLLASAGEPSRCGLRRLDVVAYCYGGLLARSLAALLEERSRGGSAPELRVFHVGVPHHGTPLANPREWKTVVNALTLISYARFLPVPLLTETGFAFQLAAGMIKHLIGSELQARDGGVERSEHRLSGLLAMHGDDPFTRALPPPRGELSVVSAYKPGPRAPRNLQLAYALTNALFFPDADSPEPSPASGHDVIIPSQAGCFDPACFEVLPEEDQIFHLNYFTHPGLLQHLRTRLLESVHAGEAATSGS